jgi:uncharacterized protein (DUF1697 family)
MALVVLLRGVNVGGHKVFRPSALVRQLADFDLVNVGAAGTFVARKAVRPAVLRDALLGALPFAPAILIYPSRDVLALASEEAFPDEAAGEGVSRFVSALAKRPRALPPLPVSQPAGDGWQVKVFGVRGRFALSLHRRVGRTLVYPNEVVEKHLGVPATTRNWNTLTAVCNILRGHE